MEEKVLMTVLLLTLISLPVVIEAQITFAKGWDRKDLKDLNKARNLSEQLRLIQRSMTMMDPLSTPTIGFFEFVKFLRDQLSATPVGDMDPQTRKLYSYLSRLRRSDKITSLDNPSNHFHPQQDSFLSSEPEQQQDVVYQQRSSMDP